jgi:hypothetical protein
MNNHICILHRNIPLIGYLAHTNFFLLQRYSQFLSKRTVTRANSNPIKHRFYMFKSSTRASQHCQANWLKQEPGQHSWHSDWLRAGWLGGWSSSPSGGKIFHFSMLSRPPLGLTQHPIQWALETLSPEVKRQEHEADHSPPTSAEVKKTWVYTSTLPYAFMA